MRRLLLVALVLAGCGGGGGSPVQTGERIMPIGDSITVGSGTTGGYRRLLESSLQAGRAFQFVGSSTENSGGMARPFHEGHGGWSILDFIGEGSQAEPGRDARFFVNAGKPELILLHVGGNDRWVSTEEYARRYRKLLTMIYEAAPKASTVWAKVLPSTVSGHRVALARVHAATDQVAAEFVAQGKRIEVVDPSTGFEPSTMTIDGVHPTAEGYQVLADAFQVGIATLREQEAGSATSRRR